MLLFLSQGDGWAQNARPTFLPQPAAPAPSADPASSALKPIRLNPPAPGETRIDAVDQEKVGNRVRLRGNARVETLELLLEADEIDYDADSGDASARGNVRFEHFTNGEKLKAARVEYNVEDQTGKFFEVSGTSPAKIEARPGILTTSNPFYFEGKWAERQKDKYILHNGTITDCKVPGAWWVLRGTRFDVVPNSHALARNSILWLRGVPIFYAPAFYKSLRKNPRRSGFLTPNVGNSSRRGTMIGFGYFWAINRSYDLTYRSQYFSQRGFAHHVDFRGKVNAKTDFDLIVYGVNDKGIQFGDTVRKQGGYLASFTGRSELPGGWQARGELNYLTSFEFRQNFTESFAEAVFAESHSIGYLSKHWSSFGAYISADRDQVFQISDRTEDSIIIKKIPEFTFISRERPLSRKLPVYFSLESAAGVLNREQPLYQTRQFVHRIDFAPRLMTSFNWKGISLVPAIGFRGTQYGSSFEEGKAVGNNIFRQSREFTLDLVLPSIARIFDAPAWTGAEKLKHVIESRATFRDVSGVQDFDRIIRFDETELVSNTRELELSITNRIFAKRKNGAVNERLSWQVWQRRYFDPTFGGAVVAGRRNVVRSAADLSGYAFLDQPRSYSPVVSALRYVQKIGVEWRTDYDPLRGHIVNSGLTADYRASRYFVSMGHNQVRNSPVLAPSSNQFRVSFGLGMPNRRGWNAGSSIFYDYREKVMQFATTQVAYNTDCCGFSAQWNRFSIGSRNENQFRVALAIANIGSFGTLRRQEKMF